MVDKLRNLLGGLVASSQDPITADDDTSSTETASSPTTTTELDPCDMIENSADYRSFRGRIALRKLILDEDTAKTWSIYECGPRQVRCPLLLLPPVSGTADVFFRQLEYLSDRGHRVISAEYPNYYTIDEFCQGFLRLLRYFKVKQVHLLGASLGGFLAQKFAQYNPSVIASLILVNAFADTSRFKFVNTVPLVWLAPAPLLRSYFISNDVPPDADTSIRAAAQFMSSRLSTLSQADLLSRLSLNLTNDYVRPERLQSLPITLMDVFDHCAASSATRAELTKMYPNARRAQLKSGSNFPYISRADEVNMHILVHLRQFNHTERAACVHFMDIKPEDEEEAHNSEFESSVELARVAEEVEAKKKQQEQEQEQANVEREKTAKDEPTTDDASTMNQ